MIRVFLLIFTLLLSAPVALPPQKIDMDEVKAQENFRWGVRAFHNGYYNDAVLSLEKALSYKPEKVQPRLWLGNALYKAGFEEAALNEWKYIIASDKSNSLLKDHVQAISFRRGIGRELKGQEKFVVAQVLDATREDYYPLRRPTSVRIRRDGTVYVVAFGSNEIVVLDVNNQVLRTIRGGFKAFDRPYDCLEVQDQETGDFFLFITEYGRNQVTKATLQGERIMSFGGIGSGEGKLLGPQYLAADGKGYLYVTDWGNTRVNKYDLDGNFILSFGGKGKGRVSLSGPTGIAVQDDRVYVADRIEKKIEVFDTSGNFLSSFGEDFLTAPEGMTFENPGLLLVADGNRILEFRLNKEMWNVRSDLYSYSTRITNISMSPNGEMYAVDFDLNKIFILSKMSTLYTGLNVHQERINSLNFPEIIIQISVEDRMGEPIVGLTDENFTITEGFREVGEPSLIRSNIDPVPLEIAILVEESPLMNRYSSELGKLVERIDAGLTGEGAWQLVSAGLKPSIKANFGASRLEGIRGATDPTETEGWRFDLGARMAVSGLVPRHSRQAIIFLTQGHLPEEAFEEYSLTEIARYMKNNFIGFYVINLGTEPLSEELEYICAETGGKSYRFYSPGGIKRVLSDIKSRISPLYTLRYLSASQSDFGEKYIDVQTQVTLKRWSGRDESGYFAPLSY